MKKKLGLEMPPYRILGACNPQFASQAIAAEPAIGALLPCNAVVRQDAAGTVHVELMDPNAVLRLVDRAEVTALAAEVRSASSRRWRRSDRGAAVAAALARRLHAQPLVTKCIARTSATQASRKLSQTPRLVQ